MAYYKRLIDDKLLEWKNDANRKPLLIRGARQVGKSTAVRELGRHFKYFVEINLEKQPALGQLFPENIDVKLTCEKLSGSLSVPIIPGETLLFIDEIQACKEAIMSLRYFKEDYPELHVIAAGSLLEFALEEIPSFAVGRIRSLYLYPFSFDEFLMAQGLDLMVDFKKKNASGNPLPEKTHCDLINQLRTFYLVGGMPAAVVEWIESRNYMNVASVHHDIIDSYQDDFAKYKKRVSPSLLRRTLHSVALQAGKKFIFAHVSSDIKSTAVKDALHLLTLAGLIIPVKHSDGTGIPLGAEENDSIVKYLFFDLGLMQTMLDTPAADILMASNVDFVNKGAASEMFAGLEMMKYSDCFQKSDMHYWVNTARNCSAEVDYLRTKNGKVIPMEIKASIQGSMQSLWIFMRKRNLHEATRCSLENFGKFDFCDKDNNNEIRRVSISPLYALSNL